MSLRALVLCDDAWHPAEIVQRGFQALGDKTFSFEFLADGAKWMPETMNEFQIVVVAKANHLNARDQRPWLTAETESVFPKFVERGGGLLLVHAGTCYKDLPEMRGVTGGAFEKHPEQCLVNIEPDASHPVAAGVKWFAEKDEHYFVSLNAQDAEIFLHSHSEHGVQPAGWTREYGAGRVCVLTPGHNLEVWLNPEFQKLLRNGLNWVGKQD